MMQRREPKNNRVRRVLKKMESKVVENAKSTLVLKGNKSSEVVNSVLTDMHMLKKPNAVKFWKKNDFYPFENVKNLEFLGFKNDTSLFCFGNHQKKRPHNIIFGRLFDWQLLDMVELGVTKYDPMKVAKGISYQEGNKPMMCFMGSHFQTNSELQRIQNVFLDFFRGKEVRNINLAGLDRLISVTAVPPKGKAEIDPNSAAGFTLLFRHYTAIYKKSASGGTLPTVELKSVGPLIDFVVRRTKLSDPDNYRRACVIPKNIKNAGKLGKNLSKDDMNNVRGQIHVGETDMSQLALRKFKAHKVAKKRERAEKRADKEGHTVGLDDADEAPKPKKRRRQEEPADEGPLPGESQKPKLRMRKDKEERDLFVKANRKKISKGIM